MAKHNAGYTLIELILAIAIGSGLIGIALAGQGQLRSQANFTAGVDKLIASIADARNQAVSGVIAGSNGTGAAPAGCASLAAPVYLAGTVWAPDTGGSYTITPAQMSTWVANGSGACQDASRTTGIGTPTPLTVTGTSVMLYMRTSGGGYNVCFLAATAPRAASFANPGSCSATAPIIFSVADQDGHSATLTIDPHTGLAARS